MVEALPAEPLRRLRVVVERSRRSTSVRFPVSFVRAEFDGLDPPLAKLVRAGAVRLKLHLVLAVMATRAPFEITDPPPAQWLAGLLGLAEPETNGARRVSDALSWLHSNGFIVRTPRAGRTPHIRLVHHGSVSAAGGRYVQAPIALWREGWVLTLSGRALAIYLVLKEASGGSRDGSATLSGSRKAQYGLSDETWARAAAELEAASLLTVEEVFGRASSRDEYEPKRRRRRINIASTASQEQGPRTGPVEAEGNRDG
jgi:hypothetical protein